MLLVVGMLSTAAGSASAAGWLAPDNLPLAFNDLGFDAQGNGIAVGVGTDGGGNTTIRATSRPFGGRWSDSVAVSRSGDSDVSKPRVAVNPHGDAVAIWTGYDDATSKQVVRVAGRPAGGAWSDPVIVSDGAVFSNDHEIAIDEQGNATAIWDEIIGSTFFVRTASRLNGSGWGEAVELSDTSHGAINMLPQLAVDPQGNTTAVWIGDGPGTTRIVQSKSRPTGGPWSAQVVDLTDSGQAEAPQVVVDEQGNATAVWETFVDNGYVVQAARRAGGSGWSAPVDLATDAHTPHVTVDHQGNATAAWSVSGSSGSVVQTASSTAGGPWSAPVDLASGASGSGVGSVGYPWVGVDQQGTVTAIWARFGSGNVIAQASRRAPAGDWIPAVDLSVGPINAIPAAGIDPQGYATVAWTSSDSPALGSSSVFDFVAPELRNPATPAKATVGRSVGMSVDPFDAWSAVAISWDFGDGQSASGATVHHTYNSPGERTVTITGVDSVGNTTQTTQKITIDPASIDPGPGPGPGPGPTPDAGPGTGPTPRPGSILTAPVLSALRQSGSRWRTHTVRRGPRLPVGSTFRFTLDRAAQVRFAFSRIVSGRRVNGRCVTLAKANRNKSRCDRYQTVGTLNRTGMAGGNTYTFRGKLRGHTLKPGRYRVLVTALANGKTSAAKSLRFTIVG